MEQYRTIESKADGLPLDVLIAVPEGKVTGIVQIVHGMQEHKERYLDFMRFLARHGYASVAHDHRGHGKSVRSEEDLGYFYDETADAIVEDLDTVSSLLRIEYPHVPVFLFGHSMGSLIVRKYLKKHDDQIQGLIISGAVYENPGATPGLAIIKLLEKRKGGRHVSDHVVRLVDGSFDKQIPGKGKNRWLSVNENNVEEFNNDPLCGFPFTLNGYKNLLSLVKDVYSSTGWQMKQPDLPVYFIAGQEDPVIGGKKHFLETVQDLKDKGYTTVSWKLYPNMRHEILKEVNRQQVYDDILDFLNSEVKRISVEQRKSPQEGSL